MGFDDLCPTTGRISIDRQQLKIPKGRAFSGGWDVGGIFDPMYSTRYSPEGVILLIFFRKRGEIKGRREREKIEAAA